MHAHEDRRSLLTRGKVRVQQFIPRPSPWSWQSHREYAAECEEEIARAGGTALFERGILVRTLAAISQSSTGQAPAERGFASKKCLLSQDRPRANHSHPTHRVSRQTALWQMPLR